MSRSYKVTGINLKAAPFGEQDRLLTILTAERGLVRAVAGGARKGKSSLSGRSNLFVVNQLVIAPGRSLDRITQAETLESFPRFSQDLPRLTAAQYLAEVALLQALEDQPQPELFDLLQGHLSRLHTAPSAEILPRLTQGIFHLLTLAGLAPQVFYCCRSQQPLIPQYEDPYWRAGFSVTAGGVVALNLAGGVAAVSAIQTELPQMPDPIAPDPIAPDPIAITREPEVDEQVNPPDRTPVLPLTAHALHCLQSLAQAEFPLPAPPTLADRDPLPPPFVGFPGLRSP
ncbi:MAG: DNA repair protein RecO, partial [Prochlorothrix sp.]